MVRTLSRDIHISNFLKCCFFSYFLLQRCFFARKIKLPIKKFVGNLIFVKKVVVIKGRIGLGVECTFCNKQDNCNLLVMRLETKEFVVAKYFERTKKIKDSKIIIL